MRKKHQLHFLRNTAVTLILAALLWAAKGYDLPTMKMAMHRAERQHMLPESRVIWEYNGLSYRDRDMLVGLGPTHITTCTETFGVTFWPRTAEEPTLVLLPVDTRYNPTGKAHSFLDPSFLLVDAPSRTQSALLHILLEYNEFSEVYTAEGRKQDFVWFFQLEKRYYALSETATDAELQKSHSEEGALNLFFDRHPDRFFHPCTVEFFDKDGTLISTFELNGGAPSARSTEKVPD